MKTTNTTADDGLLMANGVAKLLDLSSISVTALARRGRLPHTWDSAKRIRLYRRSDVETYAAQREAVRKMRAVQK